MEHFARCKYQKKTRRHVENSTLTTYYVAFHTGRFVWEVVIPPFPKNSCVGGDIWIIIRFQETTHLPLPYANINTYFSLRAKCWLMGRGRWAVFHKLLSQGLERGVLIPHSRFVFTRTTHPELLSLLFQISFFSQSPISCRQIPYPVNVSRIPHCVLVKSRSPGKPFQILLCSKRPCYVNVTVLARSTHRGYFSQAPLVETGQPFLRDSPSHVNVQLAVSFLSIILRP